VVRPAACTVHGWKKKEQIPAEEKESSRLELLVWLRKEMLLWLLLVGVKAAGKGGCRYFCCWSCGTVTLVRLLGDGWDVVFRGKDGDEIIGGGWRPRRREKGKRRLFAGKPGRKSLFFCQF
jgi:hypothetical protein